MKTASTFLIFRSSMWIGCPWAAIQGVPEEQARPPVDRYADCWPSGSRAILSIRRSQGTTPYRPTGTSTMLR
jgi:hypothetical protein